MTKNSKALGLIGLAKRAGQLTVGSDATWEALNKSCVYLLVFAEDAAPATVKRFEEKAEEISIPAFRLSSKEKLGKILGREKVAVLGVTNKHFLKGLFEVLRSE